MSRESKKSITYVGNDYEFIKVYFTNNVFGCGVSLGDYILLDESYLNLSEHKLMETVYHEHGHQLQSKRLGWLYLIVVGLTSAIFNNLWDRLFHKKWYYKDRNKWYYNRFPEKWADRLGGVVRL